MVSLGKTNLFIGFGIVTIFIGALWVMVNQGVLTVINLYPANTSGLELMQTGWTVWPIAFIVIGLISIFAGIKSSQREMY